MKTILLVPVFFLLSFIVLAQDADSLSVVRQVDSLIQVSRTFTGQGDFEKALEINAAADKLALEEIGRESAAYGNVCFNHGRIMHFKGDFLEAEKWYLESKAIREKVLGKEHPDYAWSLNNLANLYQKMGSYEKAESLHLESKAIREKILGKEHPDYLASLNNLAYLYLDMGNYPESESQSLEALSIQEKANGKGHPDYSASLNNLALLYLNIGNYEKAEPICLEVSAIWGKTLGKEHPQFAGSLNNLANLYNGMGNFEKAERLYLEVIAIWGKVFGLEDPHYAGSLSNLANLYFEMGNFEKAEPLHLEAIVIRKKVLGIEHPDYAGSLNNLANLYFGMGNFEKAETLRLECIDILGKTLDEEHPQYAGGLNNLAYLYQKMGNYEKAEPLYLEAKAIWEKTISMEHPDYLGCLNNLGQMYFEMDNFKKAETLYLEAKAIWEKSINKYHPDYVYTLNNLANLYLDMGNYEKAEPLYLEARALSKKELCIESPNYTITLHNLAILYEHQNRFSASETLLDELFTQEQTRLSKATSFLSERELVKYTAIFQETGDNLNACILARLQDKNQPVNPPFEPDLASLPSLAYGQTLFYKGFLLSAACRLDKLSAASPESEEINSRLKGFRRRLATEYALPIAERKGIAELEEKANVAEKELARSVSGLAEAIQQVNWQEVQSALKKDEAAIEFIHFRVKFPKKTDSTMYAALVLLPAEASAKAGSNQPQFIPLFEAKQLEVLLHTSGEKKADYANILYSIKNRSINPVGKPEKTLYELLWQPLEKELTDTKTIYFSPSGLLHRLNLAAIPIGIDSVLSDRYQLVELGSTRSLAVGTKAGQLVVPTQVKSSTNDAVLFGGIQYDSDITTLTKAIASIDSVSIASRGELNFFNTDSTLRVGTWGSLAFTDREVGNLERILKATGVQYQTNRGYTATEETFKSIGAGGKPSPRILHIATHGFFFPDPKTSEGFKTLPTLNEPVFKISEHPMIRSGLLLAGANHAWETGKPLKPGMEDGILTAYEISQMNLSNTELVVLSACETGLGDIQGNEGVYGLQRAFKIAGAKYLIMSLWQVPDKQTSLLMTTFYKKWLEQKMTIPEAFRAAQKELRDAGLDPYQWAGFVLVE